MNARLTANHFLRVPGKQAEGRPADYLFSSDKEALAAFQLCARLEGIQPALESSHALARAGDVAKEPGPQGPIISTCAAAATKTVFTIAGALGANLA